MLQQKELEDIRTRLLGEKEALLRQLAAIEERNAEDMRENTKELSFDEDFGDLGSDTFEREKDLSIELNVRDLIAQVDDSLERMDKGTYGKCIVCGREIDPERLKALPYASLCMEDKEREEKGR